MLKRIQIYLAARFIMRRMRHIYDYQINRLCWNVGFFTGTRVTMEHFSISFTDENGMWVYSKVRNRLYYFGKDM